MPHKDPAIRAEYHKRYAEENRDKLKAYRNKYRVEHTEEERIWQDHYREKSVEKRREAIRYYRYGLTQEQFDKLLATQEGRCAICGDPFNRTPHVDHCHTTGRVRGLLCAPCNTGLGVYEKKHKLFKRYLDDKQ